MKNILSNFIQLKKIKIIIIFFLIIFISCKNKKNYNIRDKIQIDSISYNKNFESDFGLTSYIEIFFTMDNINENLENIQINKFEIVLDRKKYIPVKILSKVRNVDNTKKIFRLKLVELGYTTSLMDMYNQFDNKIFIIINNDTLRLKNSIKRGFFKDDKYINYKDSIEMNFYYDINIHKLHKLDSLNIIN